jgi:predicted GIY-YIG superfamily endonuclease
MEAPTWIYRLYDARDRLLYIGRSRHPESRITAHRRCATGWPLLIDHWTTEQFPTSTAALRAQRRAVLVEHPLHADKTLPPLIPAAPRVRATPRSEAYVYRLFDAYGQLLYIGRSKTPEARIAQHRAVAAGWQTVIARWEIERFATMSAALRGQRRAVLAEHPIHEDLTCDLVTRPASVYRIFDAAGVLQYIGQTGNLERRLQTHRDNHLFPVDSWTVEEFSNRGIAVAAEKAAIEAERPLHNKITGGGRETGPLDRHQRRWDLISQLQDRARSGDITYRAAIEELVLAGLDIWKAADKLGLETGWPNHRRKYPTVDAIMALNGRD